MKQQLVTTFAEFAPLAEILISHIERPAAVVADGDEIVAHNAPWLQATRSMLDRPQRETLERSLRHFDPADALLAALRGGAHSVGVIALHSAPDKDAPDTGGRVYAARWSQIELPSNRRQLAVLILQSEDTSDHTASIMAAQQVMITHLLVRQTLIEETERRRLGQALHDVVAQELAQIRSMVLNGAGAVSKQSKVVTSIDRVIDEVRTLSFELSPPVLEDLGLRSALRWLAEHLSKQYGTPIHVALDDNEPDITKETRIIVFRAVRELLVNASKHAPGTEIVITCVAKRSSLRIMVRDTGPGFSADHTRIGHDESSHFGLLSVEQQIRGVGGSFNLVSSVGEGTRATITVPTTSHGAPTRV
ncbi:MAG: sensor histidine kinase [Phycisphaerales bacterium]|nr:MAG: sensor histidine kinase [Phycisphaerales bacterium]